MEMAESEDWRVFTEAREAFENVLQADLHNGSMVVHLATSLPDTQVPEYARLSLSNDMIHEFLSVYNGFLADYRRGWQKKDIELVPYDPERDTGEHVVEWIYLPHNELITSEIEPLAHDSLTVITPKRMADKQFTSKLRFYSATVNPWLALDHPLIFYRRYSASKVLGTSLIGAWWDGNGVFDRLPGAVFLFDRDVDCIQYGQILFIFRQYDFHLLFQFEEAIRDSAVQTLERIRKRIPISNYDEFVRDSQKPLSKLLKLRHINQQDYLDEISIDDLERVIEERGIPVTIEQIDGVKHVRYDPEHKWDLLALLDDDHVRSRMARRDYQSHKKSPVSSRKAK